MFCFLILFCVFCGIGMSWRRKKKKICLMIFNLSSFDSILFRYLRYFRWFIDYYFILVYFKKRRFKKKKRFQDFLLWKKNLTLLYFFFSVFFFFLFSFFFSLPFLISLYYDDFFLFLFSNLISRSVDILSNPSSN